MTIKRAGTLLVALALLGAGAVAYPAYRAKAEHGTAALLDLGSEAACGAYSGLPRGFGSDRHAGM
ncbi:MAG: formylglycine-generating enzyme family protein, partial [Massilia sp.]